MNKQNIKDFIESLNAHMNDTSIDFVGDYAGDHEYLSDCFREFADSQCPVYYNQVNEECTDEMIDDYLSNVGAFEIRSSSDIDALKMSALANSYESQLFEDEENIKKCIYAEIIMEDETLLNAVEKMSESEFESLIDDLESDSDDEICTDKIYDALELDY